MKASSPTEPEPFRKLSKNDILQTTDQWKERTIHKLGEVSGLWISWAMTNQVPKVPEHVPEPPTKPSSEPIMRVLKARMRQARYNEAAAKDPKFAEEKTVDDVPLPDDIEVLEEYDRLKVKYQKEARDYERQEKMALETFPLENKKVFSRLIDCISEASVQDLKRTKEGAKYFEEGNSFNFLQLAVREHEYLSPDVSSAAVARAKDDFESLRQKSEDFITEHVNEFKRKLEVYLKARGPGQPSPYADFDLRDLLLRSLYQPTWGAWIEARYVNDNMPRTYEELVTALKKAETTKILRTSSPIDPFQPTAHATSCLNDSPVLHRAPPAPPNPQTVELSSVRRSLTTRDATSARRSSRNRGRRRPRRERRRTRRRGRRKRLPRKSGPMRPLVRRTKGVRTKSQMTITRRREPVSAASAAQEHRLSPTV